MSAEDRQPTRRHAEASRRGSMRQWPALVLVALFKGYQYCISPLFPPVCRFVPSCSQYAIDAVRKHGALRGAALALWRILRCHPFSRGGYDPVK